jgi:nucleotidyltransferase AbiEii toxin of type IV toxin-antitoxin system
VTANRPPPYATPMAFRRALTDRLRAMAAPHGAWPLPDLQRQFAYDRLLTRLYLLDDAWIVKGATAMLARRIAVRHTIDIDIYRAARQPTAERDLRAALDLDAGDWFRFEAGRARRVADGAIGLRVPVVARLGATSWAKFHVDVVAEGVRMTGTPDHVPPLTALGIPGLAQPGYRVYPLVDHIADKTCAILGRQANGQRPSTRFKDLVDLVSLIANVGAPAEAQRRALLSEADRRSIVLPARFDVPDVALWEPGYAAEARRAVVPTVGGLADALVLVRPYLDPLLSGTAAGTWDPEARRWGG